MFSKMDFENVQHLQAIINKLRNGYLRRATTTSISDQQAATTRDVPVKGPVWVSKFDVPVAKEDNSWEVLLNVVDELNDRDIPYHRPASEPLRFQWTGYRKNAKEDTLEPVISEGEKFQNLVNETTSSLTVLYIYGGTFVSVPFLVQIPSFNPLTLRTASTTPPATGA